MTQLAEKLDALPVEIAAARDALAVAETAAAAKLESIEGAAHLKEITEAEARKRRAAVEREVDAARAKLRSLVAAMPEIERRAREGAERERLTKLASAQQRLKDALAARDRSAKSLSKIVAEAKAAAEQLTASRQRVEEAQVVEAELLEDETPIVIGDEPWSTDDSLVEFLTAGPVAPQAKAEEAANERRRMQEQQDAELLASFRLNPFLPRFEQLPERLRPAAQAIMDENAAVAAEHAAQRKARKREEVAASASIYRVRDTTRL